MRAWIGLLLIGCGTDPFTSTEGGVDGSMDGVAEEVGIDGGSDVRTDGPMCVWCPQPSPTTKDLFGVAGSNANNAVVVVGASNSAFWWGGSWSPISAGSVPTIDFKAVAMTDPQNIWAVGTNGSAVLLTGSSMALGPPNPLISSKPTSYYAVARSNLLGIVTGVQFTSQTFAYQVAVNGPWLYGDGSTSYFGLDCEGAASAVGVGAGKVSTYNGATWTEISVSGTHYAVSGNANNGWIAGANGEILHYTGGNSFTPVTSGTTQDLRGIRVRFPGGDVYAVGKNGTVVYIKGGNSAPVVTQTGAPDLNAIWGDANGLWAVGNNGAIIRHM